MKHVVEVIPAFENGFSRGENGKETKNKVERRGKHINRK